MSQHMMKDEEIQARVDSLVGKGAKIVDCEQKSSVQTEEVLLLNGVQVKLVGEIGERIKEALKAGQTPPAELLSEILIKAGIEKNPVELETTMKVKSNTKTTELSTLRDRHGLLVDEKLKEVEEDDEYQTSSVEVWEKDSGNSMIGNVEYIPIPKQQNHIVLQTNPNPSNENSNHSPKVRSTENSALRNPKPKEITSNKRIEYPKLIREPTRNTNMQLKSSSAFKSSFKESPCYKPSAAFLHRQTNFELPVRVVYETFI